MKLVKTLNTSVGKGVLWVLLMTVFTIRCYDVFVYHFSSFKFSEVEKSGEESKTSDPDEDSFKKTGKDIFKFFDDGLDHDAGTGIVCISEHWRVYSLVIFKEPLRDVLTPPPNHFAA